MRYQHEPGFAIIGCGLIGQKRAAALVPGQLRAVFDLDLDRAKKLARTESGCAVAGNLEAALKDPGVSCIIVAVANAGLAPVTLAAVQAGKHVLVEKPGALRSDQLEAIAAAATASGAIVRIGYNHRFHPALLQARELIATHDFGDLLFIRGRYGHGGRLGYEKEWRADPQQSGGGELIDQGVHLIDLASWFMGEFTEVSGHAATLFWQMPVDDNAFVSLRTATGQTAWLQVSCTEWKNLFSFEIYFRRAKLHVEGFGGSYGLERLHYYQMRPELGPPDTVIYEYPREDRSWELELAEFQTDIRLRRAPDSGLPEGIRTLRAVERIYQLSGLDFAR